MTGATFSKKRISFLACKALDRLHPPASGSQKEATRIAKILRFAEQTDAPGQSEMFVTLEDYALLSGWYI